MTGSMNSMNILANMSRVHQESFLHVLCDAHSTAIHTALFIFLTSVLIRITMHSKKFLSKSTDFWTLSLCDKNFQCILKSQLGRYLVTIRHNSELLALPYLNSNKIIVEKKNCKNYFTNPNKKSLGQNIHEPQV